MLAATPLLTLLMARPVLRDEPITAGRVLAIALGFAGVVLLMSRSLRVGALDTLIGQLAQLGAALCFASTSVLARWRGGGMAPLPQAVWAAFTAALFALGLNALLGTAPVMPQLPTTWAAVLAVGVVTNGLSWLLFLRLLGTVGPTQTQMISYVVPLVAVALGVLVLGEPMRLELAGGGVLVLAALAISQRAHRRILAQRGA
jgi:drug/metabolite transporter (DMT)-like permease